MLPRLPRALEVRKYLRKRADEAAKEVPDNPLGL